MNKQIDYSIIKKSDNIKESLHILLKNNSIEYGKLRLHRIGLLILLWLTVIIVGVMNYFFYPSPLTIGVTICCLLFVLRGTALCRKNDYRWFAYFFHNMCGGGLVVAYSLIASSIEWGYYYLSFVLCILLLSIALSGFVAFKIINNKIKKGLIRPKDESKPTATSTIGPISGGIGVIIARVLPEKATPMLIMPIIGIIVGAVCATTLTIYYYGKKYDPDCELIKDIQPELEENNAVS